MRETNCLEKEISKRVHNSATHFTRRILVFLNQTIDVRHHFLTYHEPRSIIAFLYETIYTFFSYVSIVHLARASNKNWFRSYRNVIESVGKWEVPSSEPKRKTNKHFFLLLLRTSQKFTHFMHCENLKHIIITCD